MYPSVMSSFLPHAPQALRSLRRYPLPLRSGKEAKILQHFGDRLCRMLDERLKQHLASGGERLRELVIPKFPGYRMCLPWLQILRSQCSCCWTQG